MNQDIKRQDIKRQDIKRQDIKRQDVSQLSLGDLFRMEVTTQMALYNHALLNLETEQDNSQSLQELMRAAHSIKGAAKIVQADVVVAIAHELEEYFVAAQSGLVVPDPEHVDVLLLGADLILEMSQLLDDGNNLPKRDDDRIFGYLETVRSLMTDSPVSLPPLGQPESLQIKLPEIKAPNAEIPSPRVNRDNLQRLMDLAGETLVSVNELQGVTDELLKLKKRQSELTHLLEQIQDQIKDPRLQEKLALARRKSNECNQAILAHHTEIEGFTRKSSNLADRFYREVVSSQMRPFGEIGQGFPRMVRDVARQLGKQVRLEILGPGTLVDRDILDRLETPLIHLLRNAIDHGIETPEQRQTRGKSKSGLIQIEASHRSGQLFITVRDDGRGIDLIALGQKIVAKGLADQTMVDQMDRAELLSFLYLPGFSTADQVTEISGRGVGLDIVHSMLQSVGGTIHTTTSQGTTFHLQLPVTLSVMRTLLVQVGGEPYALPLSRVDRLFRTTVPAIQYSEGRPYVLHNEQAIGLVSAAQILGLTTTERSLNQELMVVVVQDAQEAYHGLVVDQVLGEQSLVLRTLDKRLGKVTNFSNAALLNNGTPLLVIDMDDLLRGLEKYLLQGDLLQMSSANNAEKAAKKRILVVDDSITVREMERKLLENAGYHVEVAVNGIDAWNALLANQFDLLVTDIDMPRMNGIELIRQLRGQANMQRLPTIIVSYKERESDRLQGMEVGADYYLTKSSFHDDSLLQAVVDLVGVAGK